MFLVATYSLSLCKLWCNVFSYSHSNMKRHRKYLLSFNFTQAIPVRKKFSFPKLLDKFSGHQESRSAQLAATEASKRKKYIVCQILLFGKIFTHQFLAPCISNLFSTMHIPTKVRVKSHHKILFSLYLQITKLAILAQ